MRAPFAGTITRRLVDTVALIHAGGNASAVFEVAQMDTLRIHINGEVAAGLMALQTAFQRALA